MGTHTEAARRSHLGGRQLASSLESTQGAAFDTQRHLQSRRRVGGGNAALRASKSDKNQTWDSGGDNNVTPSVFAVSPLYFKPTKPRLHLLAYLRVCVCAFQLQKGARGAEVSRSQTPRSSRWGGPVHTCARTHTRSGQFFLFLRVSNSEKRALTVVELCHTQTGMRVCV